MSERVILDAAPIYRGVRAGDLNKSTGALTYRAFQLRNPDEKGLSISEIQANALASLDRLKGTAEMLAGSVRNADLNGQPLGLLVVPMVQRPREGKEPDPGYGQILNLPPYVQEDPEAQALAQEVADALLELAAYHSAS